MTSEAADPTPHEFRHDPNSLVIPLSALVRWSGSGFFDQMAERSGVRMDRSAMAIVAVLRPGLKIRQTELAVLVGVERSTLSRQISAVRKLGLVEAEQDSQDKRATLLSLTPDGLIVKNLIASAWSDLVDELIDDWTTEDRADLQRLLAQLVDSMHASYEKMNQGRGLASVLPAYVFDNRVHGQGSTWSRDGD